MQKGRGRAEGPGPAPPPKAPGPMPSPPLKQAGGDQAAPDIAAVKLKPTTTRVRTRDGRILAEQRCESGFQAEQVGCDVSKPQYVQDQEAGISKLEPKVYDKGAKRWKSQPPPGEAAGALNRWLIDDGALRIVSYNVWFQDYRKRERADALFRILESCQAEVICLQEVTKDFLGWMRDLDWVRTDYALSDAVGNTLIGSQLAYGVVMLIKRTLALTSFSLHTLPSQMNRRVLLASIPVADNELRVATAHLESLDNTKTRKLQLETILPLLVADGVASLFVGDMNFDSGQPEDEVVSKAGFSDCWRYLCQADRSPSARSDGITMPIDDYLGRGTRIDRVFMGPLHQNWRLVPKALDLLGTEPIDQPVADCEAAEDDAGDATDPDMPELIDVLPGEKKVMPPSSCPSDHFGLFCTFEIAKRRALSGKVSLGPLVSGAGAG
eukprot:TRINITY_DN30328_c0_g1_i2.p1 TRINITY_DN30328_c0_g1~~TRINITY_DN30328_c0_g1_i2.p1  ORF type:complete len:438 (-),score=79.33 TRINITY_DN30328_c0_g1_i2:1-1314(-)